MRNRANTYVRTGRSYGGILRNSRNESQNAYNDAYYETGTTFDRVGNRLNRTNLYNDQSHTRDPRYNRHGYNQQMTLVRRVQLKFTMLSLNLEMHRMDQVIGNKQIYRSM